MFVLVVIAWGGALAYSSLAGRSMYGDGAWYVLVHLQTPFRFNDYDFQRSFASFISQAPILFGQRMGLDSSASYAALYSVGAFVFPAAAMLTALFLSRAQPVLFAANGFAIIVYGFGTNFINTEANLFFALVWLAATIIALDGVAPILRGFILPVVSFALLRSYEGMLLVGPILALWAVVAAGRAETERERFGLTLAGLFFLLGAVIGLGGFLSPRDPGNAASFLGSTFRYLKNPQIFLFLSAALAFPAICFSALRLRRVCAALSAVCGVAFLIAITRLEGFYSFDVYYHNRSFMVLSLPVFVGLLFAIHYRKPQWLLAREPRDAYAILLIPVSLAVAGDVVGTYRWVAYVSEFCAVLDMDMSPSERLQALRRSGARTAWPWTHPTMSLLLRARGSMAMVTNEPGSFSWEPFDPAKAPSIGYRGLCQSPVLGGTRPDSFQTPMSFTTSRFPSYVAGVTGFSTPERWGTWSEGAVVEIRFARPLPRSFDLVLRLGTAFGGNRNLPIKVHAGEREQSFVVDREPYETTLNFRDIGEATTLSFAIPRPESPMERGEGNDPRKLGIGFVSLLVVPREALAKSLQ